VKTPMTREALLVLGMHRSGTSALTRVLSLMSAALPRDLMRVHEDNPTGYWESRRIAHFNNDLLASAGGHWDSDGRIPNEWFSDESARAAQYRQARTLLLEEFGATPLFVLKDPRLCVLFPFWEKVLATEGIDVRVILCLRGASEVADSLAARFNNAALHPAAIPARSRSLLLWLRYLLDAERTTRHVPRIAVDYSALLSDWRTELSSLQGLSTRIAVPALGHSTAQEIDLFLNPQGRRHTGGSNTEKGGIFFASVMDAVRIAASGGPSGVFLEELAQDFDRLLGGFAPLRGSLDRLCCTDIWAERIIGELEMLHPSPRRSDFQRATMPGVLFVSRTSESRAHTYRVLHPVEELGRLGWKAEWVLATDSNLLEKISAAEVVVVSRGPWGPDFMNIRAACSEKGVRLICDIDDLTFEPEVMTSGFAYLDDLSAADRERLLGETGEILSALELCDAVTTTTRALAREASRHARRAFVLPNCFSREMLAAAKTWHAVPKPSAEDGLIRIGFANGTRTHTRNFATIAEVIADVLETNPHARLIGLGHLDFSRFPCLAKHSRRIEQRPVVPLAKLHEELTRFDINLAPLEIGNPFCEAKSEIRFTAAAALGIPTIATATDPMRHAIIHGETGLLATQPCEWREHLQALLEDSSLRFRLGEAARIDARLRFGPEKTAALARHFIRELILNFNQSK